MKQSRLKSNLLTIDLNNFTSQCLKKNLNKNQIFFLVKTCILYKKHYKSGNLLFHIFIQNANDKYQDDLSKLRITYRKQDHRKRTSKKPQRLKDFWIYRAQWWFISKKSSDRFWTRTWKFQWSRKIWNREQPSDWRRSHKIWMSKTSLRTQSHKNNSFGSSRWNISSPKKETLFWISQNYRTPQTENKHFFCSIQSKKSAFFRYS